MGNNFNAEFVPRVKQGEAITATWLNKIVRGLNAIALQKRLTPRLAPKQKKIVPQYRPFEVVSLVEVDGRLRATVASGAWHSSGRDFRKTFFIPESEAECATGASDYTVWIGKFADPESEAQESSVVKYEYYRAQTHTLCVTPPAIHLIAGKSMPDEFLGVPVAKIECSESGMTVTQILHSDFFFTPILTSGYLEGNF